MGLLKIWRKSLETIATRSDDKGEKKTQKKTSSTTTSATTTTTKKKKNQKSDGLDGDADDASRTARVKKNLAMDDVYHEKPFPALTAPKSPLSTKVSSTFGRQVLSRKASGPNIRFGTSERETAEKQYFSQEFDRCKAGREGPGPIYTVNVTSIGKQVESVNENAPEFIFGMSKRFASQRYGAGNPGPGTYSSTSAFGRQVLSYQKSPWSADFLRSTREDQNKIYMSAEFDKVKYGVDSPGPTICDDSSSLGDQVIANFKSAPRFRFGREKRFKQLFTNNASSPGVGKYEAASSFGKQNRSTTKNLPSFSFSHSNRDQRAKVFISTEHDKDHYGAESPGPAAIGPNAFPKLGQLQIDSRKPSCTAPQFGTSTRFKPFYSDNPGPGNYNC